MWVDNDDQFCTLWDSYYNTPDSGKKKKRVDQNFDDQNLIES